MRRRKNGPRGSLGDFSTDELLGEINRRVDETKESSQIDQWCDNCTNFMAWEGSEDRFPIDYIPCSKGHKMSFHVPEDYDDEWGYYRRVCRDREEINGNQ